MKRPLSGPAPRLKLPAGTCDTHMHFYGPQYPKHPDGVPPAPEATVADYRQLMTWLGIERVVVVQPNAYGDDNRCTMDSVAELGLDKARAIVVVKPGVSDAELERLTKGGARGVRFMCQAPGHLKWDAMDEMVPRVRAFGWHPIVQFDGLEFPEHEAQLKRIQGDYVIDHIGKFLSPVTPDHEAFKSLLRLLDRGNCYIKLSAPYESSRSDPPGYDDVTVLAKAIAKAAPERLLWASNWPHPGQQNYPSDNGMLDLMMEWVPDDSVRRKMFVDNPAKLYGF